MDEEERRRFPALAQLMGCYFHQDFDIYGTIDDNVDVFVISERPELTGQVPDEVEQALREFHSEAELDAFVERLGSDVIPHDGEGYRAWLGELARLIRTGEAGHARRARLGPFPGTRPTRHGSTFSPQLARAERTVEHILQRSTSRVVEWLAGPDRRLVIRRATRRKVGSVFDSYRCKSADARGIHVVLERDPDVRDDWHVQRCYPIVEARSTSIATPALGHLVGAYFHQDWTAEYDNQAQAVDTFICGSPTWSSPVITEIETLCEALPEERALYEHLLALGCEFGIHSGLETYRGWLTEIVRRVQAAT